LTVFSLVLHTNDLTRNGGLFVSTFLERFLDRSEPVNRGGSFTEKAKRDALLTKRGKAGRFTYEEQSGHARMHRLGRT
jgi:hypothetical protein